jgi:hypothetical protein
MEISTEKTKIPVFQGKGHIPNKIYIDNRILATVNKCTNVQKPSLPDTFHYAFTKPWPVHYPIEVQHGQ